MNETRGKNMGKKKILFVCSGNICRSPLAHRLFERILEESNDSNNFEVDSCGTGAWHEGQNADARMRDTAQKHGWKLVKYARQFQKSDIGDFDYLIAMDTSHFDFIKHQMKNESFKEKLFLMRDFDNEEEGTDVPDPYYGGTHGFENVYTMIDRSCRNLYKHIKT